MNKRLHSAMPRVEPFLHLAMTVLSLGMTVFAFHRLGLFTRAWWICVLAGGWIALLLLDLTLCTRFIIRPFINLQRALAELQSDATLNTAVSGPNNMAEMFRQLLQKQAAVEIMKREAEINALQSQINPHFLYNTLETIRGQALCAGATDVANTTKALADIFRYNISKKGTMIFLNEELANIDAYMQIQQIRFGNKFELRKEIDDDVLEIRIPKLVVQPLIENALKYGLEVKRGKGRILIRAFRTQTELIIMVQDDGMGMDANALHRLNQNLAERSEAALPETQGTSIGLRNVNNRIRLIYGEQYGISVTSAVGIGTTVTLHLGLILSPGGKG